MKKRYWIIGLAAAVVAAFAVKKAVDNKQLSAEEALEITKRTFSAKRTCPRCMDLCNTRGLRI